MTGAYLEVRGLSLGYGRTDAVKAIDIDVPKGGVVTLIGANGAGKTTTLRGLSGLLKPRGGSIRFEGHEIAGLAAHRIARMGIIQVPEGRQVFPNLTIAENLAMGAYSMRDQAVVAERRAMVLDRFPRLGERLQQQAGLLSGGEQQMLAMGRAMMGEPKLLLLDEPSMGLAPMLVQEIFEIVGRLNREERVAVLLAEQNANMALRFAQYVYVMENGRVVLDGDVKTVSENEDIKEFYLGLSGVGQRKSYRDVKHYKRRKRWLS
jgi:branched-chain amino acid transport system ATP-binding protein